MDRNSYPGACRQPQYPFVDHASHAYHLSLIVRTVLAEEAVFSTLSSAHLAPAERMGWYLDQLAQAVDPRQVRSGFEADFLASLNVIELGVARAIRFTRPPIEVTRTLSMIRRSDPEYFWIIRVVRGRAQNSQAGRTIAIEPGELALYDSSLPFRCALDPATDRHVWLSFGFPRALLPLPQGHVQRLMSAALPGRTGIGRLLSAQLVELTRGDQGYRPADLARLGRIGVDLTATLVAHCLEAESALPAQTYQQALLVRIYAFIDRHLADPMLGPELIAAAHSVSVRHLHRLFGSRGATVASWIRARRLERCRVDLTDPGQRHRPVQAIGASWGLTNPAHFSRMFRATYGRSPGDYRVQYLSQEAH